MIVKKGDYKVMERALEVVLMKMRRRRKKKK